MIGLGPGLIRCTAGSLLRKSYPARDMSNLSISKSDIEVTQLLMFVEDSR